MPAYQTTPFKPTPKLLLAGTPFYFWGSFDDRSSPTQGYIISDSAVTTTATVTYMTVTGNVPSVGDSITVVGASRSNNFNVTNATILTVSAAVDGNGLQSGVVTVTYAITSTSLGTASDGGQVIIPRSQIGEALVTGASAPAAVSFINAQLQQGRTLVASVSLPVASTVTVTSIDLQGSLVDLDSEYVTLVPTAGGATPSTPAHLATVTSGTIAGGTAEYGDDIANFRFYRGIVVGASGGTSPTIVFKIEV